MVKGAKREEASEKHSSMWGQSDELRGSLSSSGRIREPRGVFRFKTFEEFNDWKERYYPAKPKKPDQYPAQE